MDFRQYLSRDFVSRSLHSAVTIVIGFKQVINLASPNTTYASSTFFTH